MYELMIFCNFFFENIQDKVCILVTHQLQYLTEVNDIVFLDAGSVAVRGNLNQLKNSEYKSFLWIAATNDESKENIDETIEIAVNAIRGHTKRYKFNQKKFI